MEAVQSRERLDRGSTPPMIHWTDPQNYGYALCGKKLSKMLGIVDSVECVVCEDLKKSRKKR